MAKKNYLNYDEGVDHLVIYKGKEEIKSNIDTGLTIFSLNEKKEIVGIEIMGISRNLDVPLSILKNLTGCEVKIKYTPETKTVIINIVLKHKKEESPYTVFCQSADLGDTAFNRKLASSA